MIKIRQDEFFSQPLLQGGTEIVHDGQVTEEGLTMLRVKLPYADLRELERDRRLYRIDDVFTVDLLSSFITWKLGGSDKSGSEIHAPALVSPGQVHQ